MASYFNMQSIWIGIIAHLLLFRLYEFAIRPLHHQGHLMGVQHYISVFVAGAVVQLYLSGYIIELETENPHKILFDTISLLAMSIVAMAYMIRFHGFMLAINLNSSPSISFREPSRKRNLLVMKHIAPIQPWSLSPIQMNWHKAN